MIYDLCAPKSRCKSYYVVPTHSKPAVAGINLLLCSKQIHVEVSQRLRLWDATWTLYIPPPSPSVEIITDIDCLFAMSGLHDFALAKIRYLGLRLDLITKTPASFGVHGLEVLLKLTSLQNIYCQFHLRSSSPITAIKTLSDLETMPFLTGLIAHVLSHIPKAVRYVGWHLHYPGITPEGNNTALMKIVERCKSVRGSAYKSQPEK